MKLAALQFLALASLSVGFETQPRLTTKSMQHRSYSDVPVTASTWSINQSTTSSSTRLFVINPILFSPEVIGPVILMIGAAAATILADNNVEEVEVVAESFSAPAQAPVVRLAPMPVAPTKIPAVEEPVIPKSKGKDSKVPVESSADAKSAGESIAELRRGVAKTLDDSFKGPNTQLLQRSAQAESPTNDEKVIQELIGKDDKKKRNLRQKVWRVVKKIVAPWRKWENIR